MAIPSDPWQLERFVQAQAPVYAAVCVELAAGAKRSHWMWFIFPQLKALGRSGTARHFGIAGPDEAIAYAAHPVLGARLKECSKLVLDVENKTVHDIFGTPDDLKLRSCMTLFDAVAPHERVFRQVLERYFDGREDEASLALLSQASQRPPGS